MKLKLKDLTKKQYKSLEELGLLFEIYPEASGNFSKDTNCEVFAAIFPEQNIRTMARTREEAIVNFKEYVLKKLDEEDIFIIWGE